MVSLDMFSRDYGKALRRNGVKAIVLAGIYTEHLVKPHILAKYFLMFNTICRIQRNNSGSRNNKDD
jgi:nicotinamidase-related amidase